MFPPDLVNSGYSQLKDLGSKVNLDSAKNLVSGGIDKVSGAVKGLFGTKVPSFNLPTSFNKSPDFKPTTASPPAQGSADMHRRSERAYATSPEASRKLFNAPAGAALIYPANQKYYTLFTFNQYERVVPNDAPKEKTSISIVLPMPPDLSEEFSLSYDSPELGIFGSVADSAVKEIRSKLSSGVGSAAINDLEKTLAGSVVGIAGAGMIKGITKFGGETAGAIARQATGVTPNPYLAMVFKNVELRTHTFQYRFAPRSLAELQILKKIIFELKKRTLPGLTTGSDLLFTFPDTCEIKFGPTENVPYKIKKCVLQSLRINYSPNGPAFFKTGDPVIVDISMSFKEMSAFTRFDVDKSKEDVVLAEGSDGGAALRASERAYRSPPPPPSTPTGAANQDVGGGNTINQLGAAP